MIRMLLTFLDNALSIEKVNLNKLSTGWTIKTQNEAGKW